VSVTNTNPLQDPINPQTGGTTVFGKVINKIKDLFTDDPSVEQVPLETSFGTDAESRGYGGADWKADSRSLSAWAYDRMRLEAGRLAAYTDYDLMDSEQPEVSAALDVIAEFSTQSDDPKSETFTIHSEDEELAKYLNEKVGLLGLDRKVTPTCREIAKYGCAFWEMVADENGEVMDAEPLSATSMRRNEDRYGRLKDEAFTQVDPQSSQPIAKFASWQIVHGRYDKIHGRIYGSSLLEPGRAVHKKLQMLEEGLVIGRMYRSHMRYIFSIPVDGMSAEAAKIYLNDMRKQLRKKERFNPTTGKLETQNSPINAEEDFYIGVRKEGVAGGVQAIQGQGNLDQIADVEYLQNKLFAVLKVPKALLGFERDVNAKATLTEQDVNFARTLRRMQQVVGDMIHETLRRVMVLDGIDPLTAPAWEVVMPPVSTTDELRQWQTEELKANVALIYGQKLPIVDKEYIFKTILDLSSEEISRLMSLPPESVGIETMPIPAPSGFGTAGGGSVGITPGTEPKPASPQANTPFAKTQQEIEIPEHESDERFVIRMREALNLNIHEHIGEGELKLARMVREAHDMFGEIELDRDSFVGALRKSRNGLERK